MNIRKVSLLVIAVLMALFSGCSGDKATTGEDIPFGYEDGAECMKKQDYDCAIKEFKNQLVLEENAVGYNLLGMAYRHRFNETGDRLLRKHEIEAFTDAINLDPEFLAAIKNLGFTYYQEGNLKEAGNLMRRALEIYPTDPEADKMKEIIEESKKQI